MFRIGSNDYTSFPVLGNDFILYWDDHWMVMNEFTEGGINFRNIKLILRQ